MTAATSVSPATDYHPLPYFGEMIREPRTNGIPPLPPTLGLSRHIFYDICYNCIRATGVGIVTSVLIWMMKGGLYHRVRPDLTGVESREN